jgi:hypothetical protein
MIDLVDRTEPFVISLGILSFMPGINLSLQIQKQRELWLSLIRYQNQE